MDIFERPNHYFPAGSMSTFTKHSFYDSFSLLQFTAIVDRHVGGGTSFSALFRLFVHTAISCLRDCASTSNAFIPFSATFILRPMFKQPEVNKKLLRKLVVDRTQMTAAAFTHCHIHSGGKSHFLCWCSVHPNNNILAYISWTLSAWFQCSKKLWSTGRCTFTLLT